MSKLYTLPPRAQALDVVYRSKYGLSEAIMGQRGDLPVVQRLAPHFDASQFPQRAVAAMQLHHQTLATVLAQNPTCVVDDAQWPVYEATAIRQSDALRGMLDVLGERHAQGQTSSQAWLMALQHLCLKVPNAYIPFTKQDAHRAVKPPQTAADMAWMENMQCAAWRFASDAFAAGQRQHAHDALTLLAATVKLYPSFEQHPHFGHQLLLGALPVARLMFDSVAADSGRLDAFDARTVQLNVTRWAMQCDDYREYLALSLNPFTAVRVTLQDPLLQAIVAGLKLPPGEGRALRRLHDWGQHPLRDFPAAEFPRLVMTKHKKLLQDERMVAAGSAALRACTSDPQKVASVAQAIYAVLSHDTVYPHLAFFNGTRIALGLLRDAQQWNGVSVPPYTQDLFAFGALLRQNAGSGIPADVSIPLTAEEHFSFAVRVFALCINPFAELTRENAIWPALRHAMAYVATANDAGHFDQATANNMAYSATITAPAYRAAAVVVHSDGEGGT